jgi:hypothetical protein
VADWIGELQTLLMARHEQGAIAHIQRLVPEYTPRVAQEPCQPEDLLAACENADPMRLMR